MPPPLHRSLLALRHPGRLASLLALALPLGLAAADRLKVQFFDVGQADASLVTCPDGKHRILIDSGDNKYPRSQENLRRELTQAVGPSRRIDIAIASHPHSDHIGGMAWVLGTFKIGTYIDNGRPAETTTWGQLHTLAQKQIRDGNLKYIDGTKASLTRLKLCDGVFVTLVTPGATGRLRHTNDQSVGVRLDYRQASFLFVGDMEAEAESVWLDLLSPAARALVDVDVLKVGHHASDTSSTPGFVQAASPRIAVVMCGAEGVSTNALYKHPRASTLRTFADWFRLHAPAVHAPDTPIWAYNKPAKKWELAPRPAGLWASVVDGTVTVESDGQGYFVTTSR